MTGLSISEAIPTREVPHVPAVRPGDRVLVLGGYGTGNVGDEAVLAGMLRQLTAARDVSVISRNPHETARLHGVSSVAVGKAARGLAVSDVLVIGGGGLFSRHVGPLGRTIPFFGLAAVGMGKRVVLHGVSVDHTTPGSVKSGLVELARRAAAVTVRDEASARVLGTWGVRNVAVAPDLSEYATPAPPEQGAALLEDAGLDRSRPIVGLCLNAIDPAWDRLLRVDVPGAVRALPEVQFCFVPMSTHPRVRRHNDAILGNWLQQRCPSIAVVRGARHPAEVMSLFPNFAAAVCMRFHSFLFASRAGTPIVGVPYAPKCEAWLAEHCLPAVRPGDGSLLRSVAGALACSGRRAWNL